MMFTKRDEKRMEEGRFVVERWAIWRGGGRHPHGLQMSGDNIIEANLMVAPENPNWLEGLRPGLAMELNLLRSQSLASPPGHASFAAKPPRHRCKTTAAPPSRHRPPPWGGARCYPPATTSGGENGTMARSQTLIPVLRSATSMTRHVRHRPVAETKSHWCRRVDQGMMILGKGLAMRTIEPIRISDVRRAQARVAVDQVARSSASCAFVRAGGHPDAGDRRWWR
jgi:hypothetical protein